MIAQVLPLTRTRALRGTFDYRLGRGLEDVGIGSLLRIPFGRRVELGVVVGLAERTDVPAEKLLDPVAVLPVALPEDLVELALRMAHEYCSTAARALSTMLPAGAGRGMAEREVLVAEITEAGRGALGGSRGPLSAVRCG